MCNRISQFVWIMTLGVCCLARADVPQGVDLASLKGWNIVFAEDSIAS